MSVNMDSLFISSVSVFIVLVLYKVVSVFLQHKRRSAKATALGCKAPPTLANNNILNTSRVKASIKANKEERGPQHVISTFDELGLNVHTARVPVFTHEILITRDPENVRALFTSVDFDIGKTRQAAFLPMFGKGVFTSRGEDWKHSRALVRPQFTRELVSNLDLVEGHTAALQKVLTIEQTGWTGRNDLMPLFSNFTLDAATEFLFGRSTHCQDPSAPGHRMGVEFGHHLDEAKAYVDARGALAKFYWLLNNRDFKAHCAKVHEYVDRFVEQVLRGNEKNTFDDKTNTGKYVLLNELAKETRDPLELRNEILNILTPGRDAPAALLGWVFYYLARHEVVFRKLRGIILAHFGATAASEEMTFAKLKSCEYLQYTITETMRIIAVIPMNERVAVRDTVLPRGGGHQGKNPVFVPEGTQVLIPKYAMQHREDIWGKDVEEFKPERWQGRRVGWEFIPFGGGARKCLGQQFGLTEVAFVTVRLLQRFDEIYNEEGTAPIRLHVAIECKPGNGVPVRLHQDPKWVA